MRSLLIIIVSRNGRRAAALAAAGMLLGMLAGCASVAPAPGADATTPLIAAVAGTPVVVPVPVPAAGAAPATTPPAAAPPSPLKPFADVIKEAKALPGYFTLYQKDEKVWIEILPDQFDRPFFFQINRSRGIGDRRNLNSPMLRAHIAELHKIGDLVQLLARNERFVAKAGTAIARAVRENMSDSLIGALTVASRPHPERKSVLIKANGLLLADLPGAATDLEAAYRLPYAFDARNSSFTSVRAADDITVFSVNAHYAIPKIPAPPLMPNPLLPQVAPPDTLEDVRSLFLGFVYSFAKLPDETMRPRVADDRLGHFTTRKYDFSDDLAPFPETNFIDRWRLEKQDPTAAVSEPRKPIVFWLDRNIPEKYRDTVRAGILEWNKAFEKAGFKDALRVEQQADDADFETGDARHASVRWIVNNATGAFAIGPRGSIRAPAKSSMPTLKSKTRGRACRGVWPPNSSPRPPWPHCAQAGFATMATRPPANSSLRSTC